MFLPDLVIRGPRVVTPRGTRPAAIHIRRGRIVGIMGFDEFLPESPVETVDCAIIPTPVDTHAMPYESLLRIDERQLRDAMIDAAKSGATLLVDAQLPHDAPKPSWLRRHRYAAYLEAHPKSQENDAVALVIRLAAETNARVHLLHLSSCETLTPLFRAQQARIAITAGTSPEYLTLVAEEIPDRAPQFECSPPIRERANREYLWAALANGLIRMVTSDQPHSLSATWTGARERGHSLEQLVEWMCRAPARLAGLQNKGLIDVGFEADLIAFREDEAFTPDTTIYTGRTLHGVVAKMWSRGVVQAFQPASHPRAG